MEIIQLSGYTLEEKLHIAQEYLTQKALSESGFADQPLAFRIRSHLRYDHELYDENLAFASLIALLRKYAQKLPAHSLSKMR